MFLKYGITKVDSVIYRALAPLPMWIVTLPTTRVGLDVTSYVAPKFFPFFRYQYLKGQLQYYVAKRKERMEWIKWGKENEIDQWLLWSNTLLDWAKDNKPDNTDVYKFDPNKHPTPFVRPRSLESAKIVIQNNQPKS